MNWDDVLTIGNVKRLLVGNYPTGEIGGVLLTLSLSSLAIVGCTILGITLGAMRSSRSRWMRIPAHLYIEGMRNVPILIVVFWAYFLPPYLGIDISKFMSVLVALILFTSAYIAEIVRGGIFAIPKAEVEAARALGLSPIKILRWIIVPQAVFNMIPALTGRYITVVKNTSLAFLIGLSEITEIGKEINVRLMSSPIEVYSLLLIIYFILNGILSLVMKSLEKHENFNRLFVRL